MVIYYMITMTRENIFMVDYYDALRHPKRVIEGDEAIVSLEYDIKKDEI